MDCTFQTKVTPLVTNNLKSLYQLW